MYGTKCFKITILLSVLSIIFTITSSCRNNSIKTSKPVVHKDIVTSDSKDYYASDWTNEDMAMEIALEKKTSSDYAKAKMEQDNKRLELENQIKDYLGRNLKNVGLSYYDINSGKQMIINGDKTFLAGSTVKVQMNMVLSDMIQKGQVSSDETLRYTKECYEEGTGILQYQNLSKPLPIKLLSDYSIVHSDNIATNMIIKRIGYKNMRNSIDSKLGHATDHSNNYITANDETALLKILYNDAGQIPFYSQIIGDMKNTDFHDRIDLYLPHDLVAHKIGDYSTYVNDAGIIYTKSPYILSIYTNKVLNANEVIAHISKMIYDYQNNFAA